MLKVAIAGALGRMGCLTHETIQNAPDLAYAGGFARTAVSDSSIYDDLGRMLDECAPDVLVDFTTYPKSVEVAMQALIAGVSPIVGSSGWSPQERNELAEGAKERRIGAMIVPNFAVGAVLMMRFAQEAAPHFASAEIIEMHRAEKLDKPSGTALATAERISAGGRRGEVPIHSVRMTGLLSHQEVLLSNNGELLTIRHDSLSRESFAAGILWAVRNVRSFSRLVIGLDSILFDGPHGDA